MRLGNFSGNIYFFTFRLCKSFFCNLLDFFPMAPFAPLSQNIWAEKKTNVACMQRVFISVQFLHGKPPNSFKTDVKFLHFRGLSDNIDRVQCCLTISVMA